MTGEPLWAVIPVKRLRAAKARLADILSGDDRSALAEAMMRDVLAAARACPALAGIAVVTCDARVADIAGASGAEVVRTAADEGHTAAAHAGVAGLRGKASSVLILSTDIPLVQGSDLSLLASLHGCGRAVTLARAAADGGTNALIVTPPDVIGFHFGADSEARHAQAARRAGITLRAVTIARMAFDLDRPDDVARFLSLPSPTFSNRLLRDLQARGRMGELVPPICQGELP